MVGYFVSNHIDWTTWDGLLPSQALDLFQMSLLYIELKIAANVRDCVDTIPRYAIKMKISLFGFPGKNPTKREKKEHRNQ